MPRDRGKKNKNPLKRPPLTFWRKATHPLRVLPDFCIPGWQKCGTTTLMQCLGQHPQVVPPYRKEVHYFNHAYGRGTRWYRAFFPTALELKARSRRLHLPVLTGESTPNYLGATELIERMASVLPDAKIIAMVRDPVARAYSHYQMHVRLDRETRTWEAVVRAELESLEASENALIDAIYGRTSHSYLSRGLYVYVLERLAELYPSQQRLVVVAEDLFREPQATYSRVLDFLGLEDYKLEDAKGYNQANYPDMPADLRDQLDVFFRPHTQRLCDFLGIDLPWPSSVGAASP